MPEEELPDDDAASGRYTGAGGVSDKSDLIDLDGFVLADLAGVDDSALVHALRRVLADANGHDDPIAGFQSYIEDYR